MVKRRTFLKNFVLASSGSVFLPGRFISEGSLFETDAQTQFPFFISTWEHGVTACRESLKVIKSGRSLLDAVEAGVMTAENDPEITSVGLGGLPDNEGHVTLDASIMKGDGSCGSVVFLEDIMHPVSVARYVMEKTPHVMLAGEGAREFALKNGFRKRNLLTEGSKHDWKRWKAGHNEHHQVNWEDNHDTIGLLGISQEGNLAGACTTSGLAYKLRGRVGDSPIIGAGLYVDNEVGAAVATGLGELVIKNAGSFLVVELMRNGLTPEQACKEAVLRIVKKSGYPENTQVAFIALSSKGKPGAFAIQPGFTYAITNGDQVFLKESDSYFNK